MGDGCKVGERGKEIHHEEHEGHEGKGLPRMDTDGELSAVSYRLSARGGR